MRRETKASWKIRTAVLGLAMATGWYLDVRRRSRTSRALHRTLVDLLLNALSSGDPFTARHSRRVADLADALGSSLRLSAADRATLRIAALLHDMGKIEDRIFPVVHAARPLTRDERAEVERHPTESAQILEPLESFHPGLTTLVTAHHECWNGQGYPAGLAGDRIPLGARIISMADVFDALTQPRAYHDPADPQVVMRRIEAEAGTRFDPDLVEIATRPPVLDAWIAIAERGRADEAEIAGGNVRENVS
jgi:putative nucleotidyltransferase with HDIG domain